jgi:DNA-binding MarR family transcriptional regulator
MSHARRSRGGLGGAGRDAGDEDRSLPAKVVLMELARADRPLSSSTLADRTLLSESAVTAALADLEGAGVCTVHPGDDRRPTRFEAELPA